MDSIESLTALYNAINRTGITDSLQQLLDTVLEQAQELIGFDHGALMLLDRASGDLHVVRVLGYGERARDVLDLRLSLGRGLSGWSAAHREAVRVGDVTRDARYVEGLRECRSNMVVPLIVQNEVTGVFNVESERLDAFTESHEKLLTVLGSQAALSIQAARSRRRLQRRIDQLNALYRISQLASADSELETTLHEILEVTGELVPEGSIAILLLNDVTRTLSVQASRGYRENVDGLEIQVGQGVTGRCAELGEVVIAGDLAEVEDYIPGVAGARSEIALPLQVDGRVIGVLNAESTAPNAYSQDHIRPLGVVAQQAAVVIRSAQLHDETRRMAVTDPLTGLYNRRYFVEQLGEQLRRAQRYDKRLAVLLLDCDHLKSINDLHGHLSGDRALQAIADVMRITLRETDVLARLGGDEFAALLFDADPAHLLEVVERLRGHVRGLSLVSDDGVSLNLTVSSGLAVFPESGLDVNALLREADIALYRAKRQGRDQAAAPNWLREGPAA